MRFGLVEFTPSGADVGLEFPDPITFVRICCPFVERRLGLNEDIDSGRVVFEGLGVRRLRRRC